MTIPCTKEAVIDRIDVKLDQLIEIQIDNAAIHGELAAHRKQIDDHEVRVRKIEKTPIRILWLLSGITATAAAGWAVRTMWG